MVNVFFSILGLLGDRWAIVVQDDRWYRKRSCKVLWKQLIPCRAQKRELLNQGMAHL